MERFVIILKLFINWNLIDSTFGVRFLYSWSQSGNENAFFYLYKKYSMFDSIFICNFYVLYIYELYLKHSQCSGYAIQFTLLKRLSLKESNKNRQRRHAKFRQK